MKRTIGLMVLKACHHVNNLKKAYYNVVGYSCKQCGYRATEHTVSQGLGNIHLHCPVCNTRTNYGVY